MSRATDSKSPPQEQLQQPQLQSEPPQSNAGTFFSNARNFGISGGAFNHANRDMHHTINNDHSNKSDFNNNYSGATKYNGAHKDFRGSTNNAYLGDQQQALYSSYKASATLISNLIGLDGNARGRGADEPLPSYEPSSESANGSRDRSGNNQTYLDSFLHQESQRDFQMDVQTQHERSSSRQGRAQKDQEPPSPAEADGEAQLRQCVQKFLATYVRGGSSDMSDLADVLISAGWDREAMAAAVWNDIKDVYKGNGWKAPMFVKLRSICQKWEK
ncbi:hypothetical protein F5880DRAFT_1482980 [Lentinula raphanica]|nr:hypothetical protein F5880DRAFT_1482980 [Lentinula raphanica]